MRSFSNRLFYESGQKTDPEFNRMARTLSVITLSTAVAMILISLLGALVLFPLTDIRIIGSSLLALFSMLSFFFIRMGRLRLASYILIISWWAIFALLLFNLGGLRVPAASIFVIIALMAGLLINIRVSFIFAGLTIILYVILYFVEMSGGFTYNPEKIPVAGALLIHIIIISLAVVLFSLFTRQMMESTRALELSEKKFKDFIRQSSEGIALTDEQGRIIEWNDSLQKITGYSYDQVNGAFIWDVQFDMATGEMKTPQYKKELKNMIAGFLKTGTSPQAGKQLDREYIGPDGKKRFIQGTVFPIKTEKGFMLGSLSMDITDRVMAGRALKKSKQSLESVMSNLPGMVYQCRIDRNWTMEFVSDGCFPLTGYTPDQMLFNREISYG